MPCDFVSRRNVIRSLGAAGVVGLAGCVGGDGDSSPAGGATTQGNQSQPTLRVNQSPWGLWNMIIEHIENEGILDQKFDEAGAQIELQRTWESPPLFASGQVDVAALSPLELAQIGSERQIEVVCAGKTLNLYQAFMTYQGSGYEVSETGSPEATWEKLVQDNARYMIAGWDASQQAHRLVIENEFGVAFSEDDADLNVVTADMFALPELLANQEAPVADIGPIDGGLQNYIDGGVYSPIYMVQNRLLEFGFGPGAVTINGVAVQKSAMDEMPEAVQAYVEAFDEGYSWFHDNIDSIASDPATVEGLDVPQSQEQVEFLLDMIVKTDTSAWETVPDEFEFEHPPVPEQVALDDAFVQESNEFLTSVEELGFLSEGWDEYMSYATF